MPRSIIPRFDFIAEPDPARASGWRVRCRFRGGVARSATSGLGRVRVIDVSLPSRHEPSHRNTSPHDQARDPVNALVASFPAAWQAVIISAGFCGPSQCDLELRRCDRATAMAIAEALHQVCGDRDLFINGVWFEDIGRALGMPWSPPR
jgi:hypothetical protein